MRMRPIPLFLRRLELPPASRSRYARRLSREDAYERLKKITRQDFGYDVTQWRKWIREHMTLDGRLKDKDTRYQQSRARK
jgi:hypothetical protein